MCCILFHFYIKPQRDYRVEAKGIRCILFHFYIKPQPFDWQPIKIRVVSYSISTSNHNRRYAPAGNSPLYLIPFLHQTTTKFRSFAFPSCCILFHFYIKPQRLFFQTNLILVVSYSISTSNHNSAKRLLYLRPVVSYSISTSNHNIVRYNVILTIVVSYSISTSNHNNFDVKVVRNLVVSYSISTSNHNPEQKRLELEQLYLIPFLHQTTTYGA